jgi:hypothetical protein
MRAADLPTDQRALLSLILRRGRAPEQIAGVLGIDEQALRSRARTALLALARPLASGLERGELERLADFLLGLQEEAERLVSLDALYASAPLRALARELAQALSELSPRPLELVELLEDAPPPDATNSSAQTGVPRAPAVAVRRRMHAREGSATPPPRPPQAERSAGPTPLRAPRARSLRSAGARLQRLRAAGGGLPAGALGALRRGPGAAGRAEGNAAKRAPGEPSRVGGALLLIAILGAILGALLLSGALGSSGPAESVRSASAERAPSGRSTGSSSTAAAQAVPEAIIKLTGPTGSGASGEAVIARVGAALDIAIEAHGLSPSKGASYIVWLYNSPSSFLAVGRAPAVESDGRLPGSASTLPEGAAGYHYLIVTRESSSLPTHPGEIVLRGNLDLRAASSAK